MTLALVSKTFKLSGEEQLHDAEDAHGAMGEAANRGDFATAAGLAAIARDRADNASAALLAEALEHSDPGQSEYLLDLAAHAERMVTELTANRR